MERNGNTENTWQRRLVQVFCGLKAQEHKSMRYWWIWSILFPLTYFIILQWLISVHMPREATQNHWQRWRKPTWHVIAPLWDARLFLGSAQQNVPAADFMQLRLPRQKTRYICENLEESQRELRVQLPPDAWQRAKKKEQMKPMKPTFKLQLLENALGLGPSKNAGIGPFSQAPIAAL